jgi:hypothetical protein
MTTIVTLDIRLPGSRTDANSWSARIEVPESSTLSDLHHTIQQLVEFDDDHLHEFFAGRNSRHRKVTFGADDSRLQPNEGEEVPLSEVFPLPKNHKLYYLFDFGDSWLFEITRRSAAKQADRTMKYPRLVQETGHRPEQYPDESDEG